MHASPPAISTFPLSRRVAVWAVRPLLIFPVGRNPEATMVTLAIAFFVASWTLVATTWNNPPVTFGAVYWPLGVIVPLAAPSCTIQVTVAFKEVFTLALKSRTPCGPNTSLGGMIDTTRVAMVTVAVIVWVLSARLVAITWNVPSVPGAV